MIACRKPNYVTEGHKIFAIDPKDDSAKSEIKIRGVNWFGMENIENAMLFGLWGREPATESGSEINGTSIVRTTNSFYKMFYNYLIIVSHRKLLVGERLQLDSISVKCTSVAQ